RRRSDQAVGPRTSVCGRRSAGRVCPRALWIDDPAAGDGRAGRTVAPGRSSRGFWPRRQLVVELVRLARIDRAWTRDDGGDAIVDGSPRGNALGALRGSRWT